ncbi:MAG TPA: hypothetical protein VGM67_03470 [Gemmatimonadaceae bacterium]|jgi:hypothetical protein
MRSRAGLRFLAITISIIAARAFDAWTTWVATPDLRLEQNPLESLLHVGWSGLLLLNAGVAALLVGAAWSAAFRSPAIPLEPGLDLSSFVARYWFSSSNRRSIVQAMFWLPADRRVRWAFIGGPGVALVIVASVVVGAWNLLVARGVVRSTATGTIWIAGFWLAMLLGLGLAVRTFLLHAYTRYLREA